MFKSSVIGKRANLKTGVSRKKSTPNFPKKQHFLPPDTRKYVKSTAKSTKSTERTTKVILFARYFGHTGSSRLKMVSNMCCE